MATLLTSLRSVRAKARDGVFMLGVFVLFLAILFVFSALVHDGTTQIQARKLLFPRYLQGTGGNASLDCRLVHQEPDKCAFVKANCLRKQSTYFAYLDFYYCLPNAAKPFIFIVMAFWLCLLFVAMGIVTSDFFCVNLSTLASLLGLSENLAGITFLAFGNGAPDVFVAFSALDTDSGALAMAGLIGAASFSMAVIIGSLALVRPFKVAKKSFVRDISFGIIMMSILVISMRNGRLELWVAKVMIAWYMCYVVVIVIWHHYFDRLRRQRKTQTIASKFVVSGAEANDFPAYHDFVEESDGIDDNPSNGTGNENNAQNLYDSNQGLPVGKDDPEAADEILLLFEQSSETPNSDFDSESDEEELRRGLNGDDGNMRLGGTSKRLIQNRANHNLAIKPNITGVLAFRAAISRLKASARRPSVITILDRQNTGETGFGSPLEANTDHDQSGNSPSVVAGVKSPQSEHNSSDPGRLQVPELLETSSVLPHPTDTASKQYLSFSPVADVYATGSSITGISPPRLKIAPEDSAFQGLSSTAAGATRSEASSIRSSTSTWDHVEQTNPPRASTQGVFSRSNLTKWWPSSIFPSPEKIYSTLFPTVDLWENKGFWSRLFSAAAAPCVFLFTITLPVLEADLEEDKMSDSDALDSALPSPDIAKYSGERPPLASERHPLALTSQEALDRDRGSELSEERVQLRGERSQSGQFIPLPSPPPYRENGPSVSPFPIDEPPAFEDYAEDVLLSPTWKPPPPPKEWGRWLVCLQAFAAPFLILYVAWLNDADMQDPVFLHPVAVSILCSYALLCFLLATTSPITPPMWRNSLSLLGCLLAITWISTIANEVVGVIKSIGVILDVSETILGLTVLSLGNSLGELVADVTVARLGYPIMALSACIIGPMINLLLGVGIGVTYLSAADEVGPNGFKVPIAVRVSGAAVLISLIWLLLMVWVRNWALDRLVASGLFAIWTISVVGYVVIEVLEIG